MEKAPKSGNLSHSDQVLLDEIISRLNAPETARREGIDFFQIG